MKKTLIIISVICFLVIVGEKLRQADELETMKVAARGGVSDYQVELGKVYAEGSVVERDEEPALGWYLEAAGQESAEAQAALFKIYFEGHSIEKSLTEAYAWAFLADMNGIKEPAEQLSNIISAQEMREGKWRARFLSAKYRLKCVDLPSMNFSNADMEACVRWLSFYFNQEDATGVGLEVILDGNEMVPISISYNEPSDGYEGLCMLAEVANLRVCFADGKVFLRR